MGENKNKKEKNKKKYVDVSVRVNVESVVCADDEAKADEVELKGFHRLHKAKEVDTKIGVFDDNGTSKHQSQWDFEKLRGVIQSTPKVEEVIDQELMIAFNGVDESLSIQIDFFTKIGVFDDNGISKHQSQWDFEKLRGVIQSTPKCFAEVEEVYSKLIEIYGIYQKMKLSDAKKDILEVDESLSIQIDFFTKIGVFDDNGTSKHQSQWDFEKLRGVIQSTPKCFAEVEEVYSKLIEIYGIYQKMKLSNAKKDILEVIDVDESLSIQIDFFTKIGVFDDNGTSKHQSQWDFEKLRGVIQSTPKIEELIDQELMIAFNGGRFSLNKSLFEHDRDYVLFCGNRILMGKSSALRRLRKFIVEGEVLYSSKDYKYQIYLEPIVKSFSKDKLETKLKRVKYNAIPISDLTKRIKEI
ncbi:hypothetical protein Q3G72_014555 [Acer saccharum]|nr:hypothetical protein Q3G72_014555 [Acer saccharum]